jgi:AAA domain
VRAIRDDPHDYKTLVLDTGNGAETMCIASVCEGSFRGDWQEYNSYGRGIAATTPVWSDFLGLLDQVRITRKMAVLFLHHAKVKTFQDPAGKDWDQWRPEAHDKLWGLTHKWADVIAFYGQRVNVGRDDKAQGTVTRFLRLGSSPAMVAGNRYGLPDEITATQPGAKALWEKFATTLRQCKSKTQPMPQATAPATPSQPPATAEPAAEDAYDKAAEFN